MLQTLNELFNLMGKIAIVTGGASGIGAGISEVLAEAGATVVIADINADQAEAQVTKLRDAGHSAGAVHINMTEEDSIVTACADVCSRFGTPWVLINNAGIQDRQLILEATAEDWDRTLGVNSRGPYLMTREVARVMVRAGNGGRIINIASASVIGSIVKGHAAYASSKAALTGLTSASALELAEHAITVNTILPGGVITPGAMGAQGPAPDGPAMRMPPLGMCEPQDIGAAALFLALPAAKSITNQTLAVDGGWSIS